MSPSPVCHIRRYADTDTDPFIALCGEAGAAEVGEPEDAVLRTFQREVAL